MDRITKSLFEDFVKTQGLQSSEESDAFARFVDYSVLANELQDTFELDDIETGGGNDLGLDGIAIVVNGNKFHIADYQIVNGCQTSHVLFDQQQALTEEVLVPVRLIVTPDDNVTSLIIKATNRQTEVTPDQLYALSDFQKKLESFYVSLPEDQRLYYERRSKQYSTDAEVGKSRVVSIQQQMRVFASMFLKEAHKGHYGRALAPVVGTKIFNKDHQLEPYYASAFAYYRLESFFKRKMLDAKYKPARYHLLMVLLALWSDEDLPAIRTNVMKRYCEKFFKVLWDDAQLLPLFKKCAKVIDKAAAGRPLERSLTKTEPFTKDVLDALP